MTWNADGKRWDCNVCRQTVTGAGPWCEIYGSDLQKLCRPIVKQMLREADARGDGALVNALCWFGRWEWGEDMDW